MKKEYILLDILPLLNILPLDILPLLNILPLDILPSENLCHENLAVTEEEKSVLSLPHLTDASLLLLKGKLIEKKALRLLKLTSSPQISEQSIPVLHELQRKNPKLLIVAPWASVKFDEAGFIHPKIFIALEVLKQYAAVANKNSLAVNKYNKVKMVKENAEEIDVNEGTIILHQKNEELIATWLYDEEIFSKSLPLQRFEKEKLPSINQESTDDNLLKVISLKFGCDRAKNAKNKMHLFNEQLKELLKKEEQLAWFNKSCETLKNAGQLRQDEYQFLTHKEKIYFPANKGLIIPKVILGLFAKQVKQDKLSSIHNVKNLSYAFGFDYDLRNFFQGFASLHLKICCGEHHFIIWTDQYVYGWGANDYGQLGLGIESQDYFPTLTKIEDIDGEIQEVSCGRNSTMIITSKGVYGFGNNDSGELGITDKRQKTFRTPTRIENIDAKIQKIICEINCCMFITDQGMYGCGNNRLGRLGLGDIKETGTPMKIEGIDGQVLHVIQGYSNTIIATDHHIYVCGKNHYGLLGQIDNVRTPTKITGIEGKCQEVTCGENHIIIVTDQYIYGCGSNKYGQLGSGDREEIRTPTKIDGICGKVLKAICSSNGTVIVTDQGVYGFGDNKEGQLGCGPEQYIRTPRRIDGIKGKFQAINCAGRYTILATDQGVYGCGSNLNSELGLGEDIKSVSTFTLIKDIEGKIQDIICNSWGSLRFTFILTDKGIYGFGDNYAGDLGERERYGERFIYTPRKLHSNILESQEDACNECSFQ